MAESEYFGLPAPSISDMWKEAVSDGRPILIYGMGNGADKLCERLSSLGVFASDFFASDGFVRGQSFRGHRVLTYPEAKEKYGDFIVMLGFGSPRSDVIAGFERIDREVKFFVPDMPVSGEEYFDADFYKRNFSRIERVYSSLADETSRRIYSGIVRYKLTGSLGTLLSASCGRQERWRLFDTGSVITAVDAGAYTGDTASEMLGEFPGVKQIYAIEPDPKTFKKLQKFAAEEGECKINAVRGAAWSSSGAAGFSSCGNRNSFLKFDCRAGEAEVPLVTVDEICGGRAEYIKYDVEGAEREALLGSAETIKNCRPVISVSAYHRSEDIFSLAELAGELYGGGYRLYVRRPACVPAWDIEFIFVPDERSGSIRR